MNESAILEVSDHIIRVTENNTLIYSQPGIALLPQNSAPVIGEEAQKAFRQQPTRIHSRYWTDLSTDPIQIKETNVRHSADLVWHQLSEIKDKLSTNKLCICLPSQMGQDQMQLLAGICNSLELQASYLLNSGLAQLAAQSVSEDFLHLDLQLHQLVLSSYKNQDGNFSLVSQESNKSISFIRLVDRFLHLLRDQFIQSSRFDPLHSGDTEQQLFDQILSLLNSGELKPFEIRSGSQSYKIEPSTKDFSDLIEKVKHELEEIVSGGTARAYSPEFGLLPGFDVGQKDLLIAASETSLGAALLIDQQPNSEETIFINNWQARSENEPQPSDPTPLVQTATPESGEQNSDTEQVANALLFKGVVYRAVHQQALIEAGFSMHAIEVREDGALLNSSAGDTIAAGTMIQTDGQTATAVHVLS